MRCRKKSQKDVNGSNDYCSSDTVALYCSGCTVATIVADYCSDHCSTEK